MEDRVKLLILEAHNTLATNTEKPTSTKYSILSGKDCMSGEK